VRVDCRQSGKKWEFQVDAVVCDKSCGMEPNMLEIGAAFGGSLIFDNRIGIARDRHENEDHGAKQWPRSRGLVRETRATLKARSTWRQWKDRPK
jgi:hypothetical protein